MRYFVEIEVTADGYADVVRELHEKRNKVDEINFDNYGPSLRDDPLGPPVMRVVGIRCTDAE